MNSANTKTKLLNWAHTQTQEQAHRRGKLFGWISLSTKTTTAAAASAEAARVLVVRGPGDLARCCHKETQNKQCQKEKGEEHSEEVEEDNNDDDDDDDDDDVGT